MPTSIRPQPNCAIRIPRPTPRSHGPTVPRSDTRRHRFAPAVLAALFMLTSAASPAKSQITPLQDVVPLDELEIRTNDLIELATSLADAVRELKSAQLTVRTLQKLQPSAAVTGLEMQIAQLNVQAAENKVRIMRAIAETQLDVAQMKLEFLRRITTAQNGAAQATDATSPRIQQAQATVRILQMILDIN